jgi:hypothetical protein
MESRPKETELEKLSEKMAKLIQAKEDKKAKAIIKKKAITWDSFAHQKYKLIQEISLAEGSESDKLRATKGELHLKKW